MKSYKILVCSYALLINSVYAQSIIEAKETPFIRASSVSITDQPHKNSEGKELLDESIANNALIKAQQYIKLQQLQAAIDVLQPAIEYFEHYQKNTDEVIYAANNKAETLAYLGLGAVKNQDTRVFSVEWSSLYYLKAYTLIDLNDSKSALFVLNKAIALSPFNSEYLSEAGFIQQIHKQPQAALESYKSAEQYLSFIEPESRKHALKMLLGRAFGVTLIELNQLDEAEKYLNQVLVEEPTDAGAQNELQYIKTLRENGGSDKAPIGIVRRK